MVAAGLILEGGGMRGIYTTGILDYFLEHDLFFAEIYGVSAGACHACSYLSRQFRRAFRISVDYLDDPRYCSVRSLLRTGDLFGVKMCYELIPKVLHPYDYGAFAHHPGRFYAVVTNCATGQPEYMEVRDMEEDINAVRASASLPLLSRMVPIGDNLYLDGGLSDSIPLRRSIESGNEKNVVILTRPVGYRKKPNRTIGMSAARYARFPRLVEVMANRHAAYNETLDYIDQLEKEGRIFVFRPDETEGINRIERDRKKLQALYTKGYRDAQAGYAKMMEYLGHESGSY
ncbi:MAG: patatin family protein [Lachnospiraceae bacterium]|jgi:predicted patatin/cPLA2 family phospholipase|nr:patatin family protein [Lachnospiraceae bacterium]